jgi:hypothetical protein
MKRLILAAAASLLALTSAAHADGMPANWTKPTKPYRVVGKAVAAEILLGQPAPLDHHAPGPVEDQDALARRLLESGDTVEAAHAAASFVGVGVSRTPSTRQMA